MKLRSRTATYGAVFSLAVILALPAAPQQPAISLQILPSDGSQAGIGTGAPTVSNALLAQELRRANYRVMTATAPAAASGDPAGQADAGTETNKRLGLRASVLVHAKTAYRGGKLTIHGESAPVESFQTTELTVLLEVLSPDGGWVVCVAEGKGVYRGRPGGSYTGGSYPGGGQTTTFLPPGSGVPSSYVPGANTTTVQGVAPTTATVPPSGTSPVPAPQADAGVIDANTLPGPATSTPRTLNPGGFVPPSDNGLGQLNGLGAGAGYGDQNSGEGQAALRTAIHNAVFSLSRAALMQALASGNTVRILDIDGANIVINAGSERGLHVGDVYTLQRSRRTIVDPETGQQIPVAFRNAAVARIAVVETGHSEAVLIEGSPLKAAEETETERLVLVHKAPVESPAPEAGAIPAQQPAQSAQALLIKPPASVKPPVARPLPGRAGIFGGARRLSAPKPKTTASAR